MELKQAFKTLDINMNSSKEEIELKFKELCKIHHPDKGGDSEEMKNLNNAKHLAIEYSKNKSLIKVVQELTKADNSALMRSNQIDKEVNSIYRRAQRRVGNKLRSMKDMTGLLGLISGVGTLIVSKVIPIIEFPKDSLYPKILLLFTVTLAIYYLFFNNRVTKLEENVEDFKESLDDKEYFHELLSEIMGNRAGEYISKNDFLQCLEEWTGKRINREGSNPSLIFSTSGSPRRVCRLIGLQDFSKMILLKGEQFSFIAKKESNKRQKFLVRYKILEKTVPNNVSVQENVKD